MYAKIGATLALLIVFVVEAGSHGSNLTLIPTNGNVYRFPTANLPPSKTKNINAYASAAASLYWTTGLVQKGLLILMSSPDGTGYGELYGSCEGASLNDSDSVNLPRATTVRMDLQDSTWSLIGVDPIGTTGSALTKRTVSAGASFTISYPFVTSLVPPTVIYKTKTVKTISTHSHSFYAVEVSGS